VNELAQLIARRRAEQEATAAREAADKAAFLEAQQQRNQALQKGAYVAGAATGTIWTLVTAKRALERGVTGAQTALGILLYELTLVGLFLPGAPEEV